MTAPLLAVALCLLAAAPAWADDDREVVVSVGEPGSLGLVSTAQSDGEADTEPATDRRLVERESGERVDAVVIALWTIAGVMTVLLGIFLWHTSPRRRLRLAGASTELFDNAEGAAGPSEDASTEDGSRKDSPDGDSGRRVWDRIMLWLSSRGVRRRDSEPAGSVSQPESVGESEDESAVWRFGEADGEQRSV